MATSIINRFCRLFKASVHDALDELEGPDSIARQLVRELTAEIAIHEEAVASVIGDQKVILKKRDEASREAAEWNNKAEQAVRAGRDDLALKALERAARAEKSEATFGTAAETLAPKIEALKWRLADLRSKKNDAENEMDLLEARTRAANATSRAARVLGGVGANAVDFANVRARVDKIEAGAEALNELAQEKCESDIEAQLADLTATPLTDRLAAIKSKLPPAGREAE